MTRARARDGRWPQLLAKAALTFAALFGLALVLPIVVGMATSGGGRSVHALAVGGLEVATITTDGDGGFASSFGPGSLVLPLLAAAVVTVAGAAGALRRP